MEVRAIAKNVRISPQKVRLVAAQIKKMRPEEALKMLFYIPKKSASPLQKVIIAAMANAQKNFGLQKESLMFKEIQVTKGKTARRLRPVSRGRAHQILKRTSHIRIVLRGERKKEVSNALKAPAVSKESKNQLVNSRLRRSSGSKG